jgi:hypothetical protein
LPQLRDRDIEGAGAGVEVTVPIAITFTRSSETVPYSAPQTASASADNSVFTKVCNNSRSRSGLA